MRDYTEISKWLRNCADINGGCTTCPMIGKTCCVMTLQGNAADAIEELLAAVRSVVHCKDCEWWTKQDASIQGRCARFGFYPTGKFYCASGSMAEPPKENTHD